MYIRQTCQFLTEIYRKRPRFSANKLSNFSWSRLFLFLQTQSVYSPFYILPLGIFYSHCSKTFLDNENYLVWWIIVFPLLYTYHLASLQSFLKNLNKYLCSSSCLFSPNIYLFIRMLKLHTERGRHTFTFTHPHSRAREGKDHHLLVNLLDDHNSQSWSGWGQEPETPAWSPSWLAGTQALTLRPFSVTFPRPSTAYCMQNGTSRLDPESVWDISIVDSTISC